MKHAHRYKKVNLASSPGKVYIVYRCMLPDCNHYLKPELLIGKRANCWRCGENFVVTAEMARLAKPHCKKCTEREESPNRIRVTEPLNFPGLI